MPNVFGFNNLVELWGSCDLVKRLVTRWRADGARVWSRDCYLVHHNPLLHLLLFLLLLLLLFLPPWQIGAVDKLELSTSALRQQQAATRLRCDQIRCSDAQMWPDQAHARPRRPKYRLLENNSTARWNPRLWKHICQLQHISPAFALIECASCLISATYFDVPILAQTVSCSVNIWN